MSSHDPFFDAWVREKLRDAEAPPPRHLWHAIRAGSSLPMHPDRHKYLAVVLLLLLATGGVAYWAFHVPASPSAASVASKPARADGSRPFVAANEAAGNSGGPQHARVLSSIASSRSAATRLLAPLVRNPLVAPSEVTAVSSAEVSLSSSQTLSTVTAGDVNDMQEPEPLTLAQQPASPDFGFPGVFSTPAREARLLPVATPAITIKRKAPIYLEAYAGPDHATHYITAADPRYSDYALQVHQMEEGFPSFSVGAGVSLPLAGDAWRLRLGLRYSQINEQLHYFNLNLAKTVTQVTTYRLVQAAGDTVTVHDTVRSTYNTQYFKHSLNAYRRIDLPVIFSHTFLDAGDLQLTAGAGVLLNLQSWYSGDILDTSGMPAVIHTGKSGGANAWKANVGASLYGSLALYEKLTPRVQVGVEPYLRYELSTVNKDVSIYRERFVTTGLMLGLRYALKH